MQDALAGMTFEVVDNLETLIRAEQQQIKEEMAGPFQVCNVQQSNVNQLQSMLISCHDSIPSCVTADLQSAEVVYIACKLHTSALGGLCS